MDKFGERKNGSNSNVTLFWPNFTTLPNPWQIRAQIMVVPLCICWWWLSSDWSDHASCWVWVFRWWVFNGGTVGSCWWYLKGGTSQKPHSPISCLSLLPKKDQRYLRHPVTRKVIKGVREFRLYLWLYGSLPCQIRRVFLFPTHPRDGN